VAQQHLKQITDDYPDPLHHPNLCQAARLLYSLTAGAAGLFAWVMDIRLLHVPGEHMLPDVIFMVTTLPLSFTLEWAYDLLPSLFNGQFAQLIYTTLCAAIQAALLWWLVRWAHPDSN